MEKLRTCPDIWTENAGGFAEFDPIDYGVCLEVRDDDGPGRPTEFMGHCVLSLKDLLTPGEREFELLDPLDGDNGMGAEAFVCKHGTDCGVPRCCGAFTPSMRLAFIRRGRGWSHFLF